MSLTIVREFETLNRDGQSRIHLAPIEACLVTDGIRFWRVSTTTLIYTGQETLVFECDADGKVTNWSEVAGGRDCSRAAAIADLEYCIENPAPAVSI